MDIVESINRRASIRAFKSDPVPDEILKNIIETALRAPSWGNTQPWEIAVVGGQKLEEIKEGFAGTMNPPNPDIPAPGPLPEPFISRRRAMGASLFDIRGIGREDKEKRKAWSMAGLQLFGAPNALYILCDRRLYEQEDSINVWPIFDCGCLSENIMLLATKYKLGTIIQFQAVIYPEILRRVLDIPHEKLIVIGIAIGYPNREDPINEFRSNREAMSDAVKWYGF